MLPQSTLPGQPRRRLQTLGIRQSLVPQILLLILVLLACCSPSACVRKTWDESEVSGAPASQDPVEADVRPLCHDDENMSPLDIYVVELYQRLVLVSDSTNQRLYNEGKWERILALPQEGGNEHTLSFDVTIVKSINNFTTAKVAVGPADTDHPRPCEAGLALFHRHHSGFLPCEDQPFMVRNMATFDVTSVLSSTLKGPEKTFTVQASQSVWTALLLVFIDTEDLLRDRTPLRCRAPVRSKRDTDDLARLWKTFQLRESHSRSVPTTKKILQAESNVIHSPKNLSSHAPRSSGLAGVKKHHHRQGYRGGKHSSTILSLNKQEHQRWAKGASKVYIDEEEEEAAKRHMRNDDDDEENERMHNTESHSTVDGKRASFSDEMGKMKRTLRPYSQALLSRLGPGPFFQTHAQLKQHLNKRLKRVASLRNRRYDEEACQLVPFTLDPEADLRMAPFISPQYLHIGLCLGGCPPILHPNDFVTYYTHLISLANMYQDPDRIQSRHSCRPAGFDTFTVVRWTTFEAKNYVMENWFKASVTACGCMV